MSKLVLPRGVSLTDPGSLPKAPKAPNIFDSRPHRNVGMPGITKSTPEWDDKIIATAVALGCPRWVAEQVRTHPPTRFQLLAVWCDVQDAAEGDKDSKLRVDYYRFCFEQARKDGSVTDNPEEVTGFLVDRD